MPAQLLQVITLVADAIIFVIAGFYLFKLHAKEKELNERQKKIDADYHQVVNDALAKERKILDDSSQEAKQMLTTASTEADHIIASAKDASSESKALGCALEIRQ